MPELLCLAFAALIASARRLLSSIRALVAELMGRFAPGCDSGCGRDCGCAAGCEYEACCCTGHNGGWGWFWELN